MSLVTRIIATLAAALACALPASTSATILHVTNNADSGAGTLRQAIIAGNALPADDYPDIRIDLSEWEAIHLSSDLPSITRPFVYIRGFATSRSVIDGGDSYRIFLVDPLDGGGLVWIDHLTLRNGLASKGGCLSLKSHGSLLAVSDTRFRGCTASAGPSGEALGGALYVENAPLLSISDSEFFDNTAEGGVPHGGAINFSILGQTDPGKCNVRGSTFLGNRAITTRTTGVYVRGGAMSVNLATLSVTENVFRDNDAVQPDDSEPDEIGSRGGALYATGSDGLIARNNFTMNQAGEGGAMFIATGLGYWTSQAPEVRNNTFVANIADLSGGAIVGWLSDLSVRSNSFHANIAPAGSSVMFEEGEILLAHNLVSGRSSGLWCDTVEPAAITGRNNLLPASSCLDSSTSDTIVDNVRVQGFLPDVVYPLTRQPLRPFAHSGAIDSGDPGTPDDDDVTTCPETDGLEQPRAVDGDADSVVRCDIGAFEWQGEASLFADDFEDRIQPMY
ncbi:MAG TPA: hypothetical protein VFG73_09655 [Rhodanobacteraceae bacterium]|nr:hypothetical protein [Rhodanobacteraceae bacterium]